MAKIKNDYFDMMVKQSAFCVEAAELLVDRMNSFSPDIIDAFRADMHAVEHRADELHHDILNKLASEFITPIDQEDILKLVQIIDDVTDAIDEVTLDFYMYDFKKLPDGALELATLVNRCVKALSDAAGELKNFKKPERLRSYLVEVNSVEGEADAVYAEAIHNLFSECNDAKTLLGTKAIYESLENCCDLCEHASDVVEQIIIKNT